MQYDTHRYILDLVEVLQEGCKWQGKIHLQKLAFLTNELTDADLPFEFILWKYGPYSVELQKELDNCIYYSGIDAEPYLDYGQRLSPGDNADWIRDNFPKDDEEEDTIEALRSVCELIGDKKGRDLEKIATVLWITKREGTEKPEEVAERLLQLKPHFEKDDAQEALDELEEMKQQLG